MPTNHGESAVIRIPHPISGEDLGFLDREDYQRFVRMISRPNGLFLVTGPLASGKTTTVYAALSELNRPYRKIITAEDPVEYALNGIGQCEVGHDLSHAEVMQSILRQGPDIILVGEIHDQETAQSAVQAALSGRMVFSTLSTSTDAPGAIPRLVGLGVEPILIAGSLVTVMAQRLVRVVCAKCKEPNEPDRAEIKAAGITRDRLAAAAFMRGRGCNACCHTGYRGRTALFEVLKLNAAIRERIFNGEPIQTIREQARSLGMRTLLEDAVQKALRGTTTLEQVLGACRHEL